MFTEKFREYMKEARAVPTAHHTKRKPFIHKELKSSTHVFVRVDRSRGPLEQPYEGPFQIITRINDSLFRVNYKGQPTTINIDRLKLAFLESPELQGDESQPEPKPGSSKTDSNTSHTSKKVRFVT